ncbi:MAG: DUF7691 family protein, partial [Terriglobales bacterium]
QQELLDRAINSGNQSIAETVTARFPEDPLDPKLLPALHHLLSGAYKPGVQPDGFLYIYAFEYLCGLYKSCSVTVNVIVDQEQFPEMFEFVCTGEYDPFGLPLSEEPWPACSCWTDEDVGRFIEIFEQLDQQEIRRRTGNDYTRQTGDILKLLHQALDEQACVFVFLCQ